MTSLAAKAASKLVKQHLNTNFAPQDPLYTEEEEVIDPRTGKKKKVKKSKRPLPAGLSKRDRKALDKIRKRAHYLDKGLNVCGFRVGWTFFIGIIPGLGDVVDATLNYTLIVAPAKKLDIPSDLVAKMYLNNAVSAGLGFIPVLGDLGLAAWRANSRNALLLEAYLELRGQEFLAQQNGGPSAIQGIDGVSHEHVQAQFAPGSGMEADRTGFAGPNTPTSKTKGKKGPISPAQVSGGSSAVYVGNGAGPRR